MRDDDGPRRGGREQQGEGAADHVPQEAVSPPDQPGAVGDPDAEGSSEKPLPGELEPMAPAREPTGDGLLKDPAGPGA